MNDQTAQDRARDALLGCAVGDAFGQSFFRRIDDDMPGLIQERALGDPPWPVTDDTMLSLALFDHLVEHGEVQTAALSARMVDAYWANPDAGYGGGMHRLFRLLADGAGAEAAPRSLFDGDGSLGNGGAMRVGVLGAYFADAPPPLLTDQAEKSARVTHCHDEGVAGAVAWAHATAGFYCGLRGADLFARVAQHTGRGAVRAGVEEAMVLWTDDAPLADVVATLGNGSRVTAADTVPLCVYLLGTVDDASAEDVLWRTVSCLGDRDTTCAMLGAAVGAAGRSMPSHWVAATDGPAELWRAIGIDPA